MSRIDVARELALMLCAAERQRTRERERIADLARGLDYAWLADALDRARMLALLGPRLIAVVGDAVPSAFTDEVQRALMHARRRAILNEELSTRLGAALERAGIAALPLKGPGMARRLYGDVGMRSSNDIDLMVAPEAFGAAVRTLEREGYRSLADGRGDLLPLFEISLAPVDDWRPPIDLHWRLHWYETGFSRELVRRAERGERELRPRDELAALMLFWSRDGFAGLRHAADVAAWWDRHGADCDGPVLDETAARHPSLRQVFAAGSALSQRLLGVPADRLLSDRRSRRLRVRLAQRLANPVESTSKREAYAGVVAIDALLTPRGQGAAFVRRHLLLPPAEVAAVFALPEGARGRRALARAYYAVRGTAHLLVGLGGLATRLARAGATRRGRLRAAEPAARA